MVRGTEVAIVLGIFVVLALASYFVGYSESNLTIPDTTSSVKLGDAIEKPRLNFLSYIIGEIPQFLIDWTNNISATIIIIALFMILLFMFSDILSLFGTFSNQYIAWIVGIALAVIAANLKFIMLIAVIGFGLTSGLGVLSAVVGVGAPFVIFLAFHFLFFRQLKDYISGAKSAQEFKTGVREMTQGVKAAKAFGKAVGSP